MKVISRLITVLTFFILTGVAHAALITSVDRADFQTAVVGGTIDDQNFDSLAVGLLLGTLDGVTYSASGGTPIITNTFLTSTSPNGLGSTSVGFFESLESATFSFDNAITAFAIDINTFANTDGAYQGVLNIGDTVTSIFEVFPSTATGQFLGFVSDSAFTSITISATTGFGYTLDTLVYGDATSVVSAVPEPSTLAIFVLGLMGLASCRFKKQS
tara:strand:+ start:3479 stop:4123 length:645 start_codon:yes stop_codon:yes gene_type:complete